MEYFIAQYGSKLCCVIASILGALFNYNKRNLKVKHLEVDISIG